jgi:hypothetical protein
VAEVNAVVVHRELARRGLEAIVRTVQRVVAEERREKRAKDVATVRFGYPGEVLPNSERLVEVKESGDSIRSRPTGRDRSVPMS